MTNTRSILIKIISFIVVVACCAGILASPLKQALTLSASAASDSTQKGYEDRIAALKKDQEKYEKLIKEAQQDAAAFLKEKEYLDKQIENLNEQITISNNLIEEYKSAVENKEAEIVNKQGEYDKKYGEFKGRLRVSYEDGIMGYLVMLFKAKSLSDFLTSFERMTNMLEYDKRTMKNLNEEKENLTKEKTDLETIKANQQAAYDDLKKTEAELKKKSDEAANFYQKEIANEAEWNRKLKEAQAQEKKENDALDKYLEELAKKNNGVYTGGALSWPVPSNQNIVTSKFGNRTYKIWGKWVTDYHRGIDIGIPTGTPIYACADGTVEKSQWSNSYGYYVLISHGSGYTTLYAHNSSLNVKVGQKVKRGELIAKSGSTGNSSGPHLHLEIAINGKLQDPLANGILSHPKLVFY
ncbi:MAG: peptidoglycan DD-metalloendopeptidase family protein [Clostridia bacterium]|nr:peptidoglycan DD-metalloendopeptidase family protein [Clostridia bacterium]